jgi:hypothetical protein
MTGNAKAYIRSTFLIQQGPRISRLLQPQFGRVHPKKDQAVGVFRVLKGDAVRNKITFKLYTNGLSQNEINLDTRATKIDLDPNQVLYVLGGCFVGIECLGDEILVWDGYSALPMVEDMLSHDVLDFVPKETDLRGQT